MSITFTDALDLESKVTILEYQGTAAPFRFSGFTKEEIEGILAIPGCTGILFFPAINQYNEVSLLAVGVNAIDAYPLTYYPSAVLSDCPPRCKPDEFLLKAKKNIVTS